MDMDLLAPDSVPLSQDSTAALYVLLGSAATEYGLTPENSTIRKIQAFSQFGRPGRTYLEISKDEAPETVLAFTYDRLDVARYFGKLTYTEAELATVLACTTEAELLAFLAAKLDYSLSPADFQLRTNQLVWSGGTTHPNFILEAARSSPVWFGRTILSFHGEDITEPFDPGVPPITPEEPEPPEPEQPDPDEPPAPERWVLNFPPLIHRLDLDDPATDIRTRFTVAELVNRVLVVEMVPDQAWWSHRISLPKTTADETFPIGTTFRIRNSANLVLSLDPYEEDSELWGIPPYGSGIENGAEISFIYSDVDGGRWILYGFIEAYAGT